MINLPAKYSKYIQLELAWGLIVLTLGLAATAVIPRWDEQIEYCVPNTDCRIKKLVAPQVFLWHQQQAEINAEKLEQRKLARKKARQADENNTGFFAGFHQFGQSTVEGIDDAASSLSEAVNGASNILSPRSTKQFLSLTAEARRKGWKLEAVQEHEGYSNIRKVAGALSLITTAGLLWVIAQLEELQPKRDRIQELDFQNQLNNHQKTLEGESTVIKAEIDWGVASEQKQLETKYLGEDCDEFFESEAKALQDKVDLQEEKLKQIVGTQTLDGIVNPGDKVSGSDLPQIGEIPSWGLDLLKVLAQFNIKCEWAGFIDAFSVLRVKLKTGEGQKVSALEKVAEDLKVKLGYPAVPLISSQSGYVALDIPKKLSDRRFCKLEDYELRQDIVTIPIGVDIEGNLVEVLLSDPNNPHFLVGGQSGSGKSEWLATTAYSLIKRFSPNQIKFVVIDPKKITFPLLKGLPWVLEFCTDKSQALAALSGLQEEMESRYGIFEKVGVKDLNEYERNEYTDLPRILLLFDEYADFLLSEDNEEFNLILTKLSAKARASGIHLFLALQRPDGNVVDPQIRANLTAQVAMRCRSKKDAEAIMGDSYPAHELLGKGDLLFNSGDGLQRLQALWTENPKEYLDIQSINSSSTTTKSVAKKELIGMPDISDETPEAQERLKKFWDLKVNQNKPKSEIIELVFADTINKRLLDVGGIRENIPADFWKIVDNLYDFMCKRLGLNTDDIQDQIQDQQEIIQKVLEYFKSARNKTPKTMHDLRKASRLEKYTDEQLTKALEELIRKEELNFDRNKGYSLPDWEV